jgi:hypothetical protein
LTEFTKQGADPVAKGGGLQLALLHETQGFFMGTWKNVALHVWTGPATPTLVNVLAELWAPFANAHPEGVSAVHVIANNVSLPDKDARAQLGRLSNRYANQLACLCYVVEGSGFWASALRSFLTGLRMLTQGSFKQHICADIAAAARWVPTPHSQKTNVSFSPGELADALTFVRRRAQSI